eukprot:63961-Rhodomonas_salina.1
MQTTAAEAGTCHVFELQRPAVVGVENAEQRLHGPASESESQTLSQRQLTWSTRPTVEALTALSDAGTSLEWRFQG